MGNAGRYALYRILLLLGTGTGFLLLPLAPALAQEMAAEPGQPLLELLQSRLIESLNYINGLGAIAPVAFILLYLVITVAFLPASFVTLGAGVVFGVLQGTLLVFVGAMLGATAAFLVGRYLARAWVARRIAHNPKFQAIDEAIGREGRKIIFLIRLSPAFPFNLLNYALGLTKVSLKDYVLGTVGIVPGTVLYVYLGSLLGNLALLGGDQEPDPQAAAAQWALRIIGLLATLAITVYITRIARRALREAVPSPEVSSEASGG
ncbi:MAG: TVP38/TMEM64 family protein [Cyanobacteria bacterium Co-bin13]|nr:TVP38/TMEM64 family protein [Cyanobacteria bacterium Co-bin13]